MVFAPHNTTVIEFGLTPHIDRSFGFMAAALGFDYWVLPQVMRRLLHLIYCMIFVDCDTAVPEVHGGRGLGGGGSATVATRGE